MTIKLTGTIIIPMDQQPRFLPLLDDHIAASRAEPGNLKFDITKDSGNPEVFHLDEAFTDAAAFEHHQTRTKSSPWGLQSQGLARDFHKTEE